MNISIKVSLLIINLSPVFHFTGNAGVICSQQKGSCFGPPCPQGQFSMGYQDCNTQFCCGKKTFSSRDAINVDWDNLPDIVCIHKLLQSFDMNRQRVFQGTLCRKKGRGQKKH